MNCKSLIFSIVFICTGSTSILADEYQRGYSSSRTCTRNEYREEYIPGTRNDPGYVKKWEETVEVPCPGIRSTNNDEVDNNEYKMKYRELLDSHWDQKMKQKSMTELNYDGNEYRGRYGEDEENGV